MPIEISEKCSYCKSRFNRQQSIIRIETVVSLNWKDSRLIWPKVCQNGKQTILLKSEDFQCFFAPTFEWKTLAFGTDSEYVKGVARWNLVRLILRKSIFE